MHEPRPDGRRVERAGAVSDRLDMRCSRETRGVSAGGAAGARARCPCRRRCGVCVGGPTDARRVPRRCDVPLESRCGGGRRKGGGRSRVGDPNGRRLARYRSTRPATPTDPFDPAYRFGDLDDLVRNAQRQGIQLMITIWATPPGRTVAAGRTCRRRVRPTWRSSRKRSPIGIPVATPGTRSRALLDLERAEPGDLPRAAVRRGRERS